MHKSFAIFLVLTTLSFAQDNTSTSQQSAPAAVPAQTQDQAAPASNPGPPKGFVLEDATPIKLRINRTISSADAKVGDTVDFEVLEEIAVNSTVVIPKGGLAFATVTEAQSKRRMARGGKLGVNIDYVKLLSGEKAALRAVKEVQGGGHTGAMTGGIVATGIVFFPAAPFFLFMHGKDITIPKGTEITAYVNGDMKLDPAKFQSTTAASAQPAATAETAGTGSVLVSSTPDGAEIYADGAFVGNAPSTLKLSAGKHVIKVTAAGRKEWTREISVQAGSELKLNAGLEDR
jgi:hypothetical protein